MRSVQVENNFDTAVEREVRKTYVGMSDNYFQQLCDAVYQSGVRGQVWARYESEIRKEFADYNVKKFARYTKKETERVLHNPKMLKNRRKIEACVFNAKQLVKTSKESNGFWNFLKSNNIDDLVKKLKGNFKFLGYTNACAFLRHVGLDVIKPDVNAV